MTQRNPYQAWSRKENSSYDLGLVCHNVVRRDGQGRTMVELVRLLAEQSVKVTVYSYNLDEAVGSHPGVTWHRIPEPKVPQLFKDLYLALKATMALRRRRHDVVCTVGPTALTSAPTAFFACFSQEGWRQVWQDEGESPDQYRRFHGWLSSKLESLAIRKADALLVVSRRTASELGPKTPSASPVIIVPGGIDIEEFPLVTGELREAAREELGVEDDRFALGFIGEYHTFRKGLAYLAEAVALGDVEDETILVRGEGSQKAFWARIDSARPGMDLRFLGPGAAQPVIAAADVVVIPSLYEPFSLVGLEAAAAGKPLIISERAGVAPYLVEARAALSVDPVDVAGFRSAIDRLRDRPDEAAEMGQRARKVAEEMIWSKVSEPALHALADLAFGRSLDGLRDA